MQERSFHRTLIDKDGTSQAKRGLPSLAPDYAKVEERSISDWIKFAQNLAKELAFVDLENDKKGNWKDFLNIEINRYLAYVQNPDHTLFTPGEIQAFSKPHRVIFLSFLQILETYFKPKLNSFSEEHLNYYYKEYLGLSHKASIPDKVHLWFELSPRKNNILVPEKTKLLAGKDSLGKELIYETSESLVVNNVKLAEAKSLYLEKERIELKDAREAKIRVPEEGFLNMLKVVLGSPAPGDELPEFSAPFDSVPDNEVFIKNDILAYLKFNENQIGMSFSELRLLIRTLAKLKPVDPQEEQALWQPVNEGLVAAGQKRIPPFTIGNFTNIMDFHGNFEIATGTNPIPPNPVGTPFETFPLIDNVYDLYAEIKSRQVDEATRALIEDDLFFPSVAIFQQMMRQLVSQIRENWLIIYAILQKAGTSQNPSLDLLSDIPLTYLQDFEQMVSTALPGLEANGSGYGVLANSSINSLKTYQSGLENLNSYFYLRSEDLVQIFETYSANLDPADQDDLAWEQVYELMQQAYEAKDRTQIDQTKQQAIIKVYTDQIADGIPHVEIFDRIVLESLGDPNPGDNLPKDLNHLGELTQLGATGKLSYLKESLFMSENEFEELLKFRDTPDPQELSRIAKILAVSEGKKRGYVHPGPARIEQLNHIYATKDATSVDVKLGVSGEDTNRWRTFGESQLGRKEEERNMQGAEIGFAVRSPLLRLGEGIRKIKLTCKFKAHPHLAGNFEDILNNKPFKFYFSGIEGWYELPLEVCPVPTMEFEGQGEEAQLIMKMMIVLDEQAPGIEMCPTEIEGVSQEEAVMQVLIREFSSLEGIEERFRTDYQAFKDLSLETLKLEVSVENLNPTHLQNGQGILDPKKSIEPFGVQARAGASLLIGHPETSFKRLDGLDIHLTWMGIPQGNMGQYYANYVDSTTFTNGSFHANLNLFDNGSLIRLSETDLSLFHATDATLSHKISLGQNTDLDSGNGSTTQSSIHEIIQRIPLPGQDTYEYSPESNPQIGNKLSDWNRYLELKLNSPGFMDEIYPSRASKLAIKLAMEIAANQINRNTNSADFEINNPYTPQLENISLSYTASTTFDFLLPEISEYKEDEFLHIHPFGYSRIGTERLDDFPLVPRIDQEGTLYLGFENLEAPQIVSLLIQVAEGSADPDLEATPLTWKYLSNKGWKSLNQGFILQDQTHGLTNSGIVRIMFPEDASQEHELMPQGLYWISIEIENNTLSVCDMVNIHTQGVEAVFLNQNNADDHLESPLAPEAISKFQKNIPGIKSVSQPYSSFDGKMVERDEAFYIRVSERLRHKQRALNIWDYEHLVLENFPQIYKVKCLPADIDTYPDQAGKVDIIVIPDIKGKFPFDPFEPKAPINLLHAIEKFLVELSSPFAEIRVQNPEYIQLKLRFAVKFYEGKDPGFYTNQLKEELKQFLAPWAYEQGSEIEFGGKVYPNAIVNFVDEREYVDYLAGIQVFTSEDGTNFFPAKANPNDGGISLDMPGAIWVSARDHEIDLIKSNTFEQQLFEGIGHMQIELDFQME